MKRGAIAFLSGCLFSSGLCISGMTQPSKVLGFLDVAGAWDPSLAFVMAGAVIVTTIAFRVSARRRGPILGDRFAMSAASAPIDFELIAGAAIFGIGWGLAGLCPGPAIVSLASGRIGSIVFVAAMLVGILLHRAFKRAAERRAPAEPRVSP